MFKHPKYYKELRDAGTELAKRNAVKLPLISCPGSSPARNKSDQAISDVAATARTERAPGPGHKQQVSSSKPQAPSFKRQASEASSDKPQAPSYKRQA